MNISGNRNSRETYFEVSRKLGAVVDERFGRLLSQQETTFPEKKEVVEYMYCKKRGHQKLRPNVVFGSYCVFSEQDPVEAVSHDLDQKVIDLMTNSELLNIAHYAQNIVHDGKRKVLEPDKVNDRRKVAFCINSYLADAIKLVSKYGDECLSTALQLNDLVLRSFVPEMVIQTEREKYITNDELFQRQFYEILSGEGVGGFFANCVRFGYQASNTKKTEQTKKLLNNLEDILWDFGIALEELNALGDFMLPRNRDFTHEKISSDQLADLREGIITPPIRMLYQRLDREGVDFLEGIHEKRYNTPEDHKRVLKMLFATNTYEDLSKSIKKKSRRLRKLVRSLPIHEKSRWFIQHILSMLESNKIFNTLQLDYKSIGSQDD